MTMKYDEPEKVNVGVVKEKLSAYVAKAEKGGTTVICRRNRPVAEIVPVEREPMKNRTTPGSDRGSVAVDCDLVEPAMDSEDWGMLK